jgi:hypothetical protein
MPPAVSMIPWALARLLPHQQLRIVVDAWARTPLTFCNPETIWHACRPSSATFYVDAVGDGEAICASLYYLSQPWPA